MHGRPDGRWVALPVTVLLALAALPGAVDAGPGLVSPSGLGLGGAHTAVARDIDATLVNPANLALDGNSRLSIKLFGLNGRAGNSGLTARDLYDYSGVHLTDEDMARILESFDGDCLDVSLAGQLESIGVSSHGFAVATGTVTLADGVLPRDLFELALHGNELGREYSVSETRGAGVLISAATASGAYRLAVPGLSEFALGGSVRYLRGWYFAEIERAEGGIVTTLEGLTGVGEVVARASERGSGIGFDVGIAGRRGAGLVFGLAVQNIAARMRWREAEKNRFFFAADSLTLEDLERGRGWDDLVEIESSRAATDDFEVVLPATVRLGFAYARGRWLVAGDLVTDRGGDKALRSPTVIAFGTEWRPIAALPLRTGLAFGPDVDSRFSVGLGAALGAARIDLAVVSEGGPVFGRVEGFGGALGFVLSFR